mmetsp:Transcript_13652/g.35084  ORF Transcript_13652/g.35084 Transcript_13652/m.35084 type:complete len:277 (-) Transcript_13652:19-849(-)|eukprot:CAMPEP_0182921436 /NCGR_PEP_ID=MMETSP0105_2-20130417/4147_1 /TAXON_ID=81532 ORGANISM="Acanthoeca-like sp., Strain 10tr" /NCGR_SAMPLE_ID=MMETSP0105_2 /ASSEMBLY_ACC=CAM_ASM_000205 /LENGTH=276 /DNA_ID=CAMNT_0025058957 /DNA_START=131 /DNA_END=961 /DNA_ORIENTATION=-
MSADEDVDRDIFNGRVPIAFALVVAEVPDRRAANTHEPYYLLAPRTGYLPLCAEKIRRHYNLPTEIDADADEMWFEHRGRPLRWNHPIGVLFDSFAGDDKPWEVTVHVKNYPDCLMRAGGNAVETHYINQVKQACQIKHGTTEVTRDINKSELWFGIQNDDFEHFHRVNKKLMEKKAESPWFKHVPFQLYLVDEKVRGDPDVPAIILQQLVNLITDDGIPNTLEKLIEAVLGKTPFARVVMHGVEPPLETPLQWLCEHFVYPDNFLHITVFVSAAH